MRVLWTHLDREELDAQLSPSRTAKDPWGVLARHELETAALDHVAGITRVEFGYGPAARQRYDLTLPSNAGEMPCLAFIHGGFWQEGSRAGSGFAARALAKIGWAHCAIGYTLAPEAALGEIIDEIAAALRHLFSHAAGHGIDPRRIVLAGHSAGGHLAASVLAGMGGTDLAGKPAAYVLISGVFDLAPVAASYVNDKLGMELADVDELSPLLYDPLADRPVLILIGGDETEAFQRQSDALSGAWSPQLSRLRVFHAAGRDHFDVLDELSDPGSAIVQAILKTGTQA